MKRNRPASQLSYQWAEFGLPDGYEAQVALILT